METKRICPICNKEFEITDYKQNSRKYCFECSPDRTSQGINTLRRAMRKEAVKRLGGKCARCGYDKCYWALDFHHKNPTEKTIAFGRHKMKKWEDYWGEAQKCELLCANCHRELHYEESI